MKHEEHIKFKKSEETQSQPSSEEDSNKQRKKGISPKTNSRQNRSSRSVNEPCEDKIIDDFREFLKLHNSDNPKKNNTV